MTSSGNKHQRDYRFIDSFYTKTLKSFLSTALSQLSRRHKLQANKNFPVFMTPKRNKHKRDHGLIDGSFHKNFESHVTNSLDRDNQRSNKDKLPYFDKIIMQ